MPTWTDAQKNAIDSRGGTVLVSAAAGSGKTAVLVERIISLLTDETNPVAADRLLVVTFTKAAAAEMKERINKAIRTKIREFPNNGFFRTQQSLLSQANISTVDSFCTKLVRENFYNLDVKSDFGVVDENLGKELQNQALGEVLDEYFEYGNTYLADFFSSDKDDKKLESAIKTLYNFTSCHLFPDKWFSDIIDLYDEKKPVSETVWGKILIDGALEKTKYFQKLLDDTLRAAEENEKIIAKRESLIVELKDYCQKLENRLNEGKWDEISNFLSAFSKPKKPVIRGMSEDSLKKRVDAAIDEVQEELAKKLPECFSDSEEIIHAEIAEMKPLVLELRYLTQKFGEAFSALKREKNVLDFNDLERLAVNLLIEKTEDGYERSDLAVSLCEKFDEVMIDEYQDTNQVQDAIFWALSKDDKNRFMVGDIKQSIYGFRLAMPEIFLNYKKSFDEFKKTYHDEPALINLDRNFRSTPEVIDSVNYFFRMLMMEEVGGIDYKSGEELVLGRTDFTPNEKNITRVDILENDDESGDADADSPTKRMKESVAEARHIAYIIRDMMDNGYTVPDKDGERPVKYSDFTILLRNAKNVISFYTDELALNGIPTKAKTSDRFFDRPEILGFFSFLQIVDNPNRDIPLLSVMLSPVYGFTPDDVARLRLDDKKNSLYVSLRNSGNERFKSFLDDIEMYRIAAVSMSAADFITYLFDRTGYLDIVGAMGDADGKIANLRKLREMAASFESQGYVGVSGFVRIVNRMIENGGGPIAESNPNSDEDCVVIQTVHSSKGLQYPVCIVAGSTYGFKKLNDEVALNMKLGMGLKMIDKNRKIYYNTIMREAILRENYNDSLAEELRIFYVALTRAEYKLIIVDYEGDLSKSKVKSYVTDGNGLTPFALKQCAKVGDWITLCLLKHPSAFSLRKAMDFEENMLAENTSPMDINVVSCESERLITHNADEEKVKPNEELLSLINQATEYEYSDEKLTKIPSKATASQLAHDSFVLKTLPRPAFMSEKGLTATERGTAFHEYLHYCDFKKAAADPLAELDRLLEEKFITEEQADAIDVGMIGKFFESELGKNILTADATHKEWQFGISLKASEIEAFDTDSDEDVYLQGAIDLYFEKAGELYIVDYKTDRVKTVGELSERYSTQLDIYKKALELITGKEVRACYLYSLRLGEAVTIC